jgi:predicted lipoprotein with Yx(FWY)xxD motif
MRAWACAQRCACAAEHCPEGNRSFAVFIHDGRNERKERPKMPKQIIVPAAVAVAALALSACGSSSSGSSSTQTTTAASSSPAGVVVHTASVPSVSGAVLVDSSGMTLYHLSAEKNGKFICTASACTTIWHPLTITAGTSPSGTASLAVVTRPDGTKQVTYAGEPLYTFASDSPGKASGQGLKDVGTWTAVTVSGSSAGASTSTSGSSSSGGGGETGTSTESGSSYKY